MEIEFDPAKAQSNFRKHGVHLSTAAEVFEDSRMIVISDPDSTDEHRFVGLGFDLSGRMLVVHTTRGDRVQLISARKASRGEARQYHA